MDWEDKAMAAGIQEYEVHIIHDLIGETIIDEHQFKQILLDYARHLLPTYENDEEVQKRYADSLKRKQGPYPYSEGAHLEYDLLWSKEMEKKNNRIDGESWLAF